MRLDAELISTAFSWGFAIGAGLAGFVIAGMLGLLAFVWLRILFPSL